MISLLGSLLGFGTSFAPKILDVVKNGQEHKQKLELMKLQMEMAEKGTTLKLKVIRTPEPVAQLLPFQGSAIDHSAISPANW